MYPEAKVKYSIELIRKAESLALKMQPESGFRLAFSGGKDSQVLYQLAKMGGVKFKPEMQVTTMDPPELMHFVRSHYPDVKLNRPAMNFFQLLRHKKILPTRQVRYCCSYLKESSGHGTCTLLGIRAAESTRRAKRNETEIIGNKFSGTFDQFSRDKETSFECINGTDKIVVSPIFKWTTTDVWAFLRFHEIPYCKLYDEGQHRIGCLFCPMASAKQKQLDYIRYPKFAQKIIESIKYIQEEHPDWNVNQFSATPKEVFEWWISDKNMKEYFGVKRNQLKLPFPDL